MKKILALIFTSVLFITNVNAASKCSYKEQTELNGKAGNVKVSYEIVREKLSGDIRIPDGGGTLNNVEVDAIEVTLLNLSEEIYVTLSNDYNNSVVTYKYSDSNNGIVKFKWGNRSVVTNFTINVYSSDKTSCPNEVLKTLYLTTPRYNSLSEYSQCSELKDFYLCQRYVTFKEVEEGSFFTKIEQFRNKEIDDNGENIIVKKTFTDRIFDFIKDNKWFIVSGVVLVVGAVIAVNYNKNKKQRDLGL